MLQTLRYLKRSRNSLQYSLMLALGFVKSIDCIRVDGAMDEGPSHEEVQYWWTKRHLVREKLVALVTTWSSGSSYLNRVELQNGCLSRGHANTFIPSTLAGSCIDPETGALDSSKLASNMDLAIDAYIERVDGCPCGENQKRGAAKAAATRRSKSKKITNSKDLWFCGTCGK